MARGTRPNFIKIWWDNFYWTCRHRTFNFHASIIGVALGSLTTLTSISAKFPDWVTGVGLFTGLLGAVSLWRDNQPYVAEARNFMIRDLNLELLLEITRLSSGTPNRVLPLGSRIYLLPTDVNQRIRSGELKNRTFHFQLEKFKLPKEEPQRQAFEHFRRKAKVLWNDPKVRLDTDLAFSAPTAPVQLRRTDYFDFLASGFYSCRQWLFNNEVVNDGLRYLTDNPDQLSSATRFLPLDQLATAHHIGISVLLITRNKQVLVQQTKARAGVGSFAPSGSGSLDVRDLLTFNGSFEEVLWYGARREFAEETGWDRLALAHRDRSMQTMDQMLSFPLGMAMDVSRGMITDFFFAAIATEDDHFEYDRHYKNGKLKIDHFELEPKNSILWRDCQKCDTPDKWAAKMRELFREFEGSQILQLQFLLLAETFEESGSDPTAPWWVPLCRSMDEIRGLP